MSQQLAKTNCLRVSHTLYHLACRLPRETRRFHMLLPSPKPLVPRQNSVAEGKTTIAMTNMVWSTPSGASFLCQVSTPGQKVSTEHWENALFLLSKQLEGLQLMGTMHLAIYEIHVSSDAIQMQQTAQAQS